jgi:AcrR family transcriptional regulator
MKTKQKILESAINLFAMKGYTETGMRELAASVGIKESGLYNYFPSKSAILECILEEFAQINDEFFKHDQLIALQGTLENNPTADGILSCLSLSFPKEKEGYYLKQLYVILQEQHRNPLVRKFMSEKFIAGTEEVIRTIIDKLKELKVLRPDTNPDYWVKTHSSLIYAFSSRLLLGIGDNTPDFIGMGMRELLRVTYDTMLKTCGFGIKRRKVDSSGSHVSPVSTKK